ncbi:MAG TPA: S-methyl-5-thioribose-1-phosphate isomerase [Candidatus Krumholzibacteria bacterium]|nr:S-methyl-5-thioribose-1-phosphate isomerase [Candidatus Krumholzibacteria bacterium]
MPAFPPLPTARFASGALRIIDQTLLPGSHEVIALPSVDRVCEAIRLLRVRGAPAIGVAAAYGLLVAIEETWPGDTPVFASGIDDAGNVGAPRVTRVPAASLEELQSVLARAADAIGITRPTAVNLAWAIERMRGVWERAETAPDLLARLAAEADAILAGDLAMGRALTAHGAALLDDGDAVLTHCNTGGLATGGVGTALGVVFAARAEGKRIHVFADETRPLLQGGRLTAWECANRGVPVTLLVDGAAASLLASRRVRAVLVGADRIAANGDTANKIGTLGLAIHARRFGVPFYVVAPSSTIDASIAAGSAIPIEQRAADEVFRFGGAQSVSAAVSVYNPAFDVTPAELVTAIVTERGVHRPPYSFGTS